MSPVIFNMVIDYKLLIHLLAKIEPRVEGLPVNAADDDMLLFATTLMGL